MVCLVEKKIDGIFFSLELFTTMNCSILFVDEKYEVVVEDRDLAIVLRAFYDCINLEDFIRRVSHTPVFKIRKFVEIKKMLE